MASTTRPSGLWVIIPIFLLIIGIVGWLVFSVLSGHTTAIPKTTPTSTRGLGSWSFQLMFFGTLLAVAGYFGLMKVVHAWIPSILFAAGLLMLVVGFWSSEFYSATERWVQSKEECIAGRDCNTGDGSNQNSSSSARDLLCGPEQFIEKRVNSSTIPVRLEARLLCPVFAPSKTVNASLRIRFNNEEWQDWIGNTKAPKFQGTILYMDVLGTGIVRVHFGL